MITHQELDRKSDVKRSHWSSQLSGHKKNVHMGEKSRRRAKSVKEVVSLSELDEPLKKQWHRLT